MHEQQAWWESLTDEQREAYEDAQARRRADRALIRDACEVLRARAVAAIRYAEAYGHEGRTVVIDGSAYSPSTRAIPGAPLVWDLGIEEQWATFDEAVSDYIDRLEIEEDSDSEAPDSWTLGWEEGVLFAYSPDYRQED